MAKKKRVNISNRILYTLIAVGILIIAGIGIYALTPGVAPNPGHLISQIAPPSPCNTGQFLQFDGTNWICALAGTLWSQSGNNIYYNSGSVGIGTSSPTQKLDVNGSVNANSFCIGSNCMTSIGGSDIFLASAGSTGNWQWTQVVNYDSGSIAGPVDGHSSVTLSATQPVLGIKITGYTDDSGWCAASIKGFYTGISTNSATISALSLTPSSSASSVGTFSYSTGSNGCAGDIIPSGFIFDSIPSGTPNGFNGAPPYLGITDSSVNPFLDAKHASAHCLSGYLSTAAYNKAAGLMYIPPGKTLDYYYHAQDGPSNERAQCSIYVLYGNKVNYNPSSESSECYTAGGTWDATNNICRFEQPSCPAGWSFSSWSSTTSSSCQGMQETLPDGTQCTGADGSSGYCTTGFHTWSHTSTIETCNYDTEWIITDTIPETCGAYSLTCSADYSAVGCNLA